MSGKPDPARTILLVWLTISVILVFGMAVGLSWGDWSVLIVIAVIIGIVTLLILWDIRMKVKAIYDKLEIEDNTPQSVISTILRWMQKVNK